LFIPGEGGRSLDGGQGTGAWALDTAPSHPARLAAIRDLPPFRDLRAFLRHLDQQGALKRVVEPISSVLELTEIHRRTLAGSGPALLLEQVTRSDGAPADMPVAVNLFGTAERVAWGLGVSQSKLSMLGEWLACLRDPQPIDGLRDAVARWPLVKAALRTAPARIDKPAIHEVVLEGSDIDLFRLPVQTCWPGEPAPLVTWPLVITRPPEAEATSRYNVGVYRMQLLDRDRAIVRWLPHRGGAAHHRLWAARNADMPIAVVIGADPATMLSAVLPLPEGISELHFSGVLRGERPRLASCITQRLLVPADAEIVLEGLVSATETMPEGPFGDHTGYYNAAERFPVVRITAITCRKAPIYVSTYTGRPPDEPSVIGSVLNELFVPIVRRHLPEIVDCWFPPEACSYRIAVVSISKRYPGHARRVMTALWGMMAQFSYTKLIIVVDADIDVRRWCDVAWAISTRMDPSRDLMLLERTPIDYLDFASPQAGLGGKLGIDATTKIETETTREWGRVITMDPAVAERVDRIWSRLGLCQTDNPKPGLQE
jgi:4-hydroxy-3-polyprenylbenzoate decarboxylase